MANDGSSASFDQKRLVMSLEKRQGREQTRNIHKCTTLRLEHQSSRAAQRSTEDRQPHVDGLPASSLTTNEMLSPLLAYDRSCVLNTSLTTEEEVAYDQGPFYVPGGCSGPPSSCGFLRCLRSWSPPTTRTLYPIVSLLGLDRTANDNSQTGHALSMSSRL